MPRTIAFLRAINVGGHTVRMDELRRIFESLGFTNVETFLAAGNVIFDGRWSDRAALETKIERQLERDLGYPVATFARTPEELAAIVAHDPFGAAACHALHVMFLKEPLSADRMRALQDLASDTDAFHSSGREIYWSCGTPMRESPAAIPLGKRFGTMGTMRNLTTVRKLAEKYGSEAKMSAPRRKK